MVVERPLILASQSPRRIALLRQIGFAPQVIPSNIAEEIDSGATPAKNAMRLALAKAVEVGRSVDHGVVVGADTIVVLDGEYLGKPLDRYDAVRMLQQLSGRTHIVVTGVALVDRPSDRSVVDYEETSVTFRALPTAEIEAYVAQGSPMDKAGAYGIQDDYGAVFVSRITGCYYNVVGLPLSKLHSMLAGFSSSFHEQ